MKIYIVEDEDANIVGVFATRELAVAAIAMQLVANDVKPEDNPFVVSEWDVVSK